MTTLHWDSRNAWGRMPPRAVQVWCIYAAMVNRDGIAWPSLPHLAEALGMKDVGSVREARRWLVDHGALESAKGYTPSNARSASLHEDRVFLRLTGVVTIDGVTYALTYAPGVEAGAEVWRGGGKFPTPPLGNFPPPPLEIPHPKVVKENVVQGKGGNTPPAESARPQNGERAESSFDDSDLPDHVPPAAREQMKRSAFNANDTAGQMQMYALASAYARASGAGEAQPVVNGFIRSDRKSLEAMAAMGVTAEQVEAVVKARVGAGRELRLAWLIEDLAAVKRGVSETPKDPTWRVLTEEDLA